MPCRRDFAAAAKYVGGMTFAMERPKHPGPVGRETKAFPADAPAAGAPSRAAGRRPRALAGGLARMFHAFGVAQTSKSAVSQVSKPAARHTKWTACRPGGRRHSKLGSLRYGLAVARCLKTREMSRLAGLLTLPLLLAGSVRAAQLGWPQFRGPFGDGHVSAPGDGAPLGLPLQWSETNNVKWKTEIPFRGWSTPAVLNGQVWLTTATQDGHDFYALCVDAASGEVRFNERLFHCDTPEPLGNSVNSYATPSPAIEPGRVYIHFGSYGTACLDTSSFKALWQRQDLPCRHYRGPASSVVLFENLVILTMDGVNLQYLVALDKKTGQTVWKTNRSVAWNDEMFTDQMTRDGDRRKAHSTPLIVEADGKLQMLSCGAKAAYAYDPRNGRELWRVQYDAWSAAPCPLFDPASGLALLISGFGGKTELLGVRADGQGDVTDARVAWRYDNAVSKTASPVLVDGLLYLVSDEGMVTCLEADTGKQVWRTRLPGNFAASPIYGDGRLYFSNQKGQTTVLLPGRTFQAAATNALAAGFMASPAVADKALFLRTRTHLYRVQN
jgi:outer membrane protein assembly factor BamB